MANRADTNRALERLISALEGNRKAQLGLLNPLESVAMNFMNGGPFVKAANSLVDSLGSVVSPTNNLMGAMKESDELQKKLLGSNSNLTTFMDKNSEALEGLRGGLFDNAQELFTNFQDGLRFNSDSLNVLQNRMRLTGQSTDQLRNTTKTLLGITNNDIDAVGRLSKTNMDLGRTYMVTNDKLLEALDRNTEVLDFASLFDEGEQTSDAIMKLTAQLTDKGVNVQKQQTIIKFLADQSIETMQMRQKLGISVDIFDQIAKGQVSLEDVLGSINSYSKQNLISNNKTASDIALKGLGDGIKEVVIASNQVGNALGRSTDDVKKYRSKEDQFYDTFETSQKEAKEFYDKTVTDFYDVMKPTPEILKAIQIGMLGSLAGGLIKGSVQGIQGIIANLSVKFKPLDNLKNIGILSPAALANQAANQTSKSMLGGMVRFLPGLLGQGLKFLGPIGFVLGTALPLITDLFSSNKEKEVDLNEATNDLNKSVAELNNNANYLKNITSADKGVNIERQAMIDNQKQQIEKINKFVQSLQDDGSDEKLVASIKADAAKHIAKLNAIAEQGRKSNLSQKQLEDLNKQAMESSNQFSKSIQENTQITAEKTAIIAKPIEKENEKDKPEKLRTSLDDMLAQSVGRALSISLPKSDGKTEELLKELKEANRVRLQVLEETRKSSRGYMGN
jgi:hypothetical protein